MGILDFLYPKKCVNCRKFGEYICTDCFSKIAFNDNFTCPMCNRPSVTFMTHPGCQKPYGLDGVLTITVYNNLTKKLIYQFKYSPHLSKLAAIIADLMIEGLIQNEIFYKFLEDNNPVIIPIPLSKKRFKERGYNHAELLASCVAQYFKIKISKRTLVRIKETKPQYKLNREERIKNMKNAFGILNLPTAKSQMPKAVILVDDITTSFTTLKESAKILKLKGAKKVIGLTFAREL